MEVTLESNEGQDEAKDSDEESDDETDEVEYISEELGDIMMETNPDILRAYQQYYLDLFNESAKRVQQRSLSIVQEEYVHLDGNEMMDFCKRFKKQWVQLTSRCQKMGYGKKSRKMYSSRKLRRVLKYIVKI